MIRLKDLAKFIPGAEVIGDSSVFIEGIALDSRVVEASSLFAVMPGENTDGSLFISQAIEKGAVALLVERKQVINGIACVVVEDVRDAVGFAAAAFYNMPASDLKTIGVTGTNGKTTIVNLVEQVLNNLNIECGVMGTLEYKYKQKTWVATHTTPEAPVLFEKMSKMYKLGARVIAMEVSSHALDLGRVNGCRFDVVACTNLSRDHLDFHKTMDAYASAKKKLFTSKIKDNPSAKIVLNLDDSFCLQIKDIVEHEVIGVSIETGNKKADFFPVKEPVFSVQGIEALIQTPVGEYSLKSPFIGRHNLSNMLVALGCCYCLGCDVKKIISELSFISRVPGRLEIIPGEHDFTVLVDYAHTPDALTRALEALKPLVSGRLITLFGCGGKRDRQKRPLMGEAVAALSDLIIVTDDNPRNEDSMSIIEMIIPGVTKFNHKLLSKEMFKTAERGYVVIKDRAEAIAFAILHASPGDLVLLAGKGHEDYMVTNEGRIHFSDKEQALAALNVRKEVI